MRDSHHDIFFRNYTQEPVKTNVMRVRTWLVAGHDLLLESNVSVSYTGPYRLRLGLKGRGW